MSIINIVGILFYTILLLCNICRCCKNRIENMFSTAVYFHHQYLTLIFLTFRKTTQNQSFRIKSSSNIRWINSLANKGKFFEYSTFTLFIWDSNMSHEKTALLEPKWKSTSQFYDLRIEMFIKANSLFNLAGKFSVAYSFFFFFCSCKLSSRWNKSHRL